MPLPSPNGLPPEVSTLVDLLRYRAANQGQQAAYRFVPDGQTDPVTWTWADLDQRARAVAAWLQARDAEGERVLLLFEEGLDYLAALFGCMYAGALACPCHPPDPERLQRTLPRLQEIARDAQIRYVFTNAGLLKGSEGKLEESPALAAATWLAVEQVDPALAAAYQPPRLQGSSLAYLQYTSGSTSTPKGVMVSHHNLLHQLTDFDLGYAHGPDSVIVSWLPSTHDLGLVYGRFMPLFKGIPCVFFSPAAFMRRPGLWMLLASRFGGTHSPAPNFGFEVAARKAREEDVRGLDLRRVKLLLNGGEPIRRESEELFRQRYAPCGLPAEAITHAMGMSESTAKIVTEPISRFPPHFLAVDPAAYERHEVQVVPLGTPGALEVAGNGSTVLDTVVKIVDPQTFQVLPEDRVGELWVGGTTVAQGYFNQPEATAATFRAVTADGAGPFLRTGDLAFLHEGELYLTGRLKDVIIIRGQNHHPQDLEWTVQTQVPAVRPNCSAAFSVRDAQGEEQLVLVAEVYTEKLGDPTTGAERVFGAIRQALGEHGLTAAHLALLAPKALPKTASGKIQRSRARELFLSGALETVARWDRPVQAPAASAAPTDPLQADLARLAGRARERRLVKHLQSLVGRLLGLSAAEVETDRPVGELGLDSITAVEMVEAAGRDLGIEVPGTLLFDHPTLDTLAPALLERLARPRVVELTEAEAEAALLAELDGL